MVPLALYLLYLVVTLPGQTSELGKLARLVTVSLAAASKVPITGGPRVSPRLQVGGTSAERRAAVRWVLIPFTLVSFAYTALGQLPAAITGHPLIRGTGSTDYSFLSWPR